MFVLPRKLCFVVLFLMGVASNSFGVGLIGEVSVNQTRDTAANAKTNPISPLEINEGESRG